LRKCLKEKKRRKTTFPSDRYHRAFLGIGDCSTKIDFILRENKVEK